jgi:predicted polyphosphate/ATP-dependent NAD kinase
MADPHRIGLIINPIAGIGGPLAARGSDCFANIAEARDRGGVPIAQQRAKRALARLKQAAENILITTAAGSMGADAAIECGFAPFVLNTAPGVTTAADTRAAAAMMLDQAVELILFAGGDGTAHDIFEVVGDRLPLVGIPAGVKMHSAVFALSPEAAGETAALAIKQNCGTRLAEIMDADEAELAAGRPSARLFGYAMTPSLPRLFQPAKAARPDGGEAAIAALGRKLARQPKPDQLLIFGPGTTMAAIRQGFGFDGSLLGVDAVIDGEVVSRDADAGTLEALCKSHPQFMLLVGVVGGQGFVFGRGNQQISPKILRAVDHGNLRIIATREKLLALPSCELRIDSGDVELDRLLEGYRRVDTGPNDTVMMRLRAGF